MGRKFILERGTKATSEDWQPSQVRQSLEVLHTLEEAIEIFIQAKKAEGLRNSTLNGYFETFNYLREWLPEKTKYVDEITSTTLRNYINYLRTERLPYQGDEIRGGKEKGLSVFTINYRLRNLKTFFRFLQNDGLIKNNPTGNIPLVRDDKNEEVPGLTDQEVDAILAS